MLCFLLILLPNIISSDVIESVGLTPSTEVTTDETVTLTCIVNGVNLTSVNSTVTWYLSTSGNTHQLHQIEGNLVENTSWEYPLDTPELHRSGGYYCDVDGVASNQTAVYFREFSMRRLSEGAVYKDQQVQIRLVQSGDYVSWFQCGEGRSLTPFDSSLTPFDDTGEEVEASLKFTAKKSINVTCEAFFGEDERVEETLYIEVLVPHWSDWGPFLDTCEIRPSMTYYCAKMRSRSCVNQNDYSTCDTGEPNSFLKCQPDECEPYVTSWGGWDGVCQYDSQFSRCQQSRQRFCTRAVNSSKTCTEELTGYGNCSSFEECDRWSAWKSWSVCYQPQDNPLKCVKERHRDCLLEDFVCFGAADEMSNCLDSECSPQFSTHGTLVVSKPYMAPFELSCDVKGSPTLGYKGMGIQWKLNSIPVGSTKPVNPASLTYLDSELIAETTGIYTCCVGNQLGKKCNSGWNVRLSDYGPVPVGDIDTVEELTLPPGADFSLLCNLEGHRLEYEWFRGRPFDDPIPGEHKKILELSQMSKEKKGLYSCCAYDTVLVTRHSKCAMGYKIAQTENAQRKYLIITISLISILIIILVLYITCVHTNKMNSFKRRFRHVFSSGHTKLYNGLDTYGGSQIIQRSQSYLKRLSRSKPLTKSELATLVSLLNGNVDQNAECSENNELCMEFDSIPNNNIAINRTPVGTENKNRYMNVLPNPHSRVLLPELHSDPTSTYVNANYVRGYKLVPNEYIATQGPLPSTTSDFWRLVWKERCRLVVMTTGLVENSRMKCCLYWPAGEIGNTVKSGDLEITQLGNYPSRYYNISIVSIKEINETDEVEEMEEKDLESGEKETDSDNKNPEERIIYHMWYHSWPDFGVPEDTGPFLDFVESVRSFKSCLETSPIIVHCSAGVGRTGTFISVNLGIEQFANTGKVDPLGYICQLRQDRGGMIQTIDQYTFVYRALHAYQLRLDHRDKDSKERLQIRYGPPALLVDNPHLPSHITLPLVQDLAGSQVPPDFMTSLTQTIRAVPRYSETASSASSSSDTIKSSCESLSDKPLVRPESPSGDVTLMTSLLKEDNSKGAKRRSKVKSLFFPDRKSVSSGNHDNHLPNINQSQRSVSLNNVKFTNSPNNSPRVSMSRSQKSVSSHTDLGSTTGDDV